MTTGRINQVTTPAAGAGQRRAVAPPHWRLVIGWHTERTRSEKRSHVVQFTEASVANTTIDANRPRWTPRRDATTSALRLPNTRCGVGIHKTVDTVAKLYESETIVPNAHTSQNATRNTCPPEPSDARRPAHVDRCQTLHGRATSTQPKR